MKLIAILLALAVEHFAGSLSQWRRLEWMAASGRYLFQRLEGLDWRSGPLGVLLVVGALPLATFVLAALFSSLGWLLGFLFGLAVLMYCLGPGDLARELEGYIEAAERGDNEAAFEYAVQVVGEDAPRDPVALAEKMKGAIFLSLNQRFLAVLFWFLVLGPVGVVLYRMTTLLQEHGHELDEGFLATLSQLRTILDWPCARLNMFAFALAGSFVDTMTCCSKLDDFLRKDNDTLMIDASHGAMKYELEAEDVPEGSPDLRGVAIALALARRSFLTWIGVIAFLTIAGWVV
ncbi:MAG TPA: hypothetical protein ENJ01_04800 [Gammaproteobacteria bacterium]|nr:hypothetical protein [Gammaproteobacteria bacterium]